MSEYETDFKLEEYFEIEEEMMFFEREVKNLECESGKEGSCK